MWLLRSWPDSVRGAKSKEHCQSYLLLSVVKNWDASATFQVRGTGEKQQGKCTIAGRKNFAAKRWWPAVSQSEDRSELKKTTKNRTGHSAKTATEVLEVHLFKSSDNLGIEGLGIGLSSGGGTLGLSGWRRQGSLLNGGGRGGSDECRLSETAE